MVDELDEWFMNDILPLEPMLLRFLRRNWRDETEIADLQQETYVRVYEAARRERPHAAKAFLFMTARNLMIDKIRRKSVVSIERMAEMEWLDICDDDPSPEQQTVARQELRILQDALESLPPRCREVVRLRKIEGLSQRRTAEVLGMTEEAIEHLVAKGIRQLAHSVYGSRRPLVATAKRFFSSRKSKVS